MSEFVEVARLSDLPEGNKLCYELNDHYIVLVNVGGTVYCLDDVCTHDGGPLGEGELDDHCLVCPRHGAKFDVRTGAAVLMPATEATGTHEVKIEGDKIFIRLSETK